MKWMLVTTVVLCCSSTILAGELTPVQKSAPVQKSEPAQKSAVQKASPAQKSVAQKAGKPACFDGNCGKRRGRLVARRILFWRRAR